ACKDSVFTYKEEWEELSERIGYWLEYWRPYVTFHTPYIESVWWILKTFAEKGLLYRGHKSVPYCPRCGTALSSHEVAQGYKDVEDPSLIFVAEVLCSNGDPDPDNRALLAWTTTPWTVPSNSGLAVHPDLEYVEVERDERRYIVAQARAEALFGEGIKITRSYLGSDLVGWRYRRPLDLVPEPADPGNGWRVVAEDFVSADDGTGIVHMAPAFGADDYAAGKRHGLPMLNPIDSRGCFDPEVDLVGGQFVKDADTALVQELRDRDLIFDVGTIVHSYPHCWRCSSPLLYVAIDSWFAATSKLKDELLANNDQIQWHPPEVGEKRFGEWLRGNIDWALSRDRYWGTPLPVWICDSDPDHVSWIGSLEELRERAGSLGDDFDPHRPFIDMVTWDCGECTGTMKRSPEVIDVWFDSGAMPYAQWHYPFQHTEEFETHFPADFICEGLDQTRGWFYSLLAISTMLGRGPSFKNCLVNDLVLDAKGQKMSKSKGNTVNPWDAVGEHGADAVRWYFITSSNPWLPKRYDPEGVREAARKFFDTLFNTYRFFSLYARVESWSPSVKDPRPEDRPLLDRWLLARLDSVVTEVSEELNGYQLTKAYRTLGDFVVEDLSNWYVRRSRSRFWNSDDIEDQRAAFRTLYDALRSVSLLAAPCVPFAADWVHRALGGGSAHLESFPAGMSELERDAVTGGADLEEDMDAVRALASLGRAAREDVKIRVRQPLRSVRAFLPGGRTLSGGMLEIVREELNVKDVGFLSSVDGIATLSARPNYRSLGARFGKQTNDAANTIRALDQSKLAAWQAGEGLMIELSGKEVPLEPSDLEVVQEAEGNLVVKGEGAYTVALDPELDAELRTEGIARELVNRTQRLRRDAGLEITDRIELAIAGPDSIREATTVHEEFIGGETLAVRVQIREAVVEGDLDHVRSVDIDGIEAWIGLVVVG
ncbi:isoleucine--tRNA ligase, partial [Gemmatimonadales bacterium]|nr:isoleucine--tRNA ligase [Gemmatimonadales bacterium]